MVSNFALNRPQAGRHGERLPRVAPPVIPLPTRPPEISVVVTVYNEESSLNTLYKELVSAMAGQRWELIVVDDGSSDGSYKVASRLHDLDRRVSVIRLRRNFGKTAALSAGIAASRGNIVITMDGDLQDDPREIPELMKALSSGLDLVTGWRRHRMDSLSKRISSAMFNKVVACLTGVPLHDMNCGLKAIRGDLARQLKLYGELHRFLPVLASQMGYRVGEVEVNHRPRRYGRSKYGWRRAISALLDIQTVVFLTRYLNRPLRLFGSAGLLLLALGITIGAYLSLLHFQGIEIGHRPLLSLAVILVLSGFQLVSTGLIGEMLRNVSFRREDEYSVESVLGQDYEVDS